MNPMSLYWILALSRTLRLVKVAKLLRRRSSIRTLKPTANILKFYLKVETSAFQVR
jgi:hypothetical protein